MAQIPYLDVQNLTKSFGSQVLFNNISFSVSEGQKVGLVAKNGTGKSTLLSILTNNEGKDSGSIIYKNDLKMVILSKALFLIMMKVCLRPVLIMKIQKNLSSNISKFLHN